MIKSQITSQVSNQTWRLPLRDLSDAKGDSLARRIAADEYTEQIHTDPFNRIPTSAWLFSILIHPHHPYFLLLSLPLPLATCHGWPLCS